MVEALNEIYDNIYKSEEESIAQHEYLQKCKIKFVCFFPLKGFAALLYLAKLSIYQFSD